MDWSHLKAEHESREEERLRQECTFKPKLATRRAAHKAAKGRADKGDDNRGKPRGYVAPCVPSRYRQAAAAAVAASIPAAAAATATAGDGTASTSGIVCRAGRRARATGGRVAYDWELDGCTFSPAVMGARKGMGHAQRYLQASTPPRRGRSPGGRIVDTPGKADENRLHVCCRVSRLIPNTPIDLRVESAGQTSHAAPQEPTLSHLTFRRIETRRSRFIARLSLSPANLPMHRIVMPHLILIDPIPSLAPPFPFL